MSKKYKYEEVIAATKNYFNGEALSADVWTGKYPVKDADGNFLELTPDDMHARMAREFARVESSYYDNQNKMYQYWYDQYYSSMKNFSRIVPQGSPMSAIGNTQRLLSASNCTVIESPEDSIHGIFNAAEQMAQLFKRRAGVGLDLSTLRPDGMSVANAALTTTGAWSFADFYSSVNNKIGQAGRRAATMITLSVHHPDVVKFATMKHDKTRVTGANVSIRLSDEFLKAVVEDRDYELRWPVDSEDPVYRKTTSARKVWDVIIDSAHKSAEPGLLFWDSMTRNLPAHCYPNFKSVSTNPCCFDKDCPVLVVTKAGTKEIKDITGDDLIWVDSEKTWAKTSGYFDAGLAEVFIVKFSNGEELNITANHKLDVVGLGLEKLENLNIDSKILIHGGGHTSIKEIESVGVKEVGCIEVEKYHKFTANGIISGNSEIILSAFDSCRLISINLTGYVRNAFEPTAYFDLEAFDRDVRLAARMSDNLVDLELELVGKILERIGREENSSDEVDLWNKFYNAGKNGRRTGLGTHGLADTLAQLRIKYDSNEAIVQADKVYRTLRDSAYDESAEIAKTRGAFPDFNWELEKDNEFIKRLPDSIKEKLKKHGRRNISMLTQAPTGSVSIVSKLGEFDLFNISSGVEPVFRNSYVRKKKINANDQNSRVDFVDANGERWQRYNIYHNNAKAYMDKFQTDELPDYFVDSAQIDWNARVRIQAAEQKYIDHSISSTINLPADVSKDVVGEIYLNSWKEGLNGITVYVDGSRDGVLEGGETHTLIAQNYLVGRYDKVFEKDAFKLFSALRNKLYGESGSLSSEIRGVAEGIAAKQGRFDFDGADELSLPKVNLEDLKELITPLLKEFGFTSDAIAPKREAKLESETHKVKIDFGDGDPRNAYITVSFFPETRKPYEVLIIAPYHGLGEKDLQILELTARSTSMNLRHGIPLAFICEQLDKVGGQYIFSLPTNVARVLRQYIPGAEHVEEKVKPRVEDVVAQKCPQCGERSYIPQGKTCGSCFKCGYSGCG